MTAVIDTIRATCQECGYPGTLAALALHSCDIQQGGGRCEDYPCCGHTDGDGCQTLPEHTGDYWLRNINNPCVYEPGTPEWHDAMDASNEYDDPEWWCDGCGTDYSEHAEVFDNGNSIDDDCASCRLRWFLQDVEHQARRAQVARKRARRG